MDTTPLQSFLFEQYYFFFFFNEWVILLSFKLTLFLLYIN